MPQHRAVTQTALSTVAPTTSLEDLEEELALFDTPNKI
jgi:hypothetical protein